MPRKSVYPQYSLEDALVLAQVIVKHNSGKPMRRLTLFNFLKKSPESGPSRSLVSASSSYGLTEGGYKAELITLKERGQKIIEQNDCKEMLDAVLGIEIFKLFFDHYKNSTVPSQVSGIDYLKSLGVSEEGADNCLNILLLNGRRVSLIQDISGSERIVSYDNAIETLSKYYNFSMGSNESKPDTKEHNTNSKGNTETSTATKINNIPSLNINIQIHLPADAKPENYEAIFKNIKTYLMGV